MEHQHRRRQGMALARIAGGALMAGLTFTAMAPMADGAFTASAQVQKAYDTRTDPLKADSGIRGMAESLMGGPSGTNGRMHLLFEMLNTSSGLGLAIDTAPGRPPKTAVETVKSGGECTEFAYVVLAVINAMNARGAKITADAQVVHFHCSPADEEHMFVRVDIEGRKVIIDPQASGFGQTKEGGYDVVRTFSPASAAAMYHRGYGDYLRDRGDGRNAMAAYERSLGVYAGDPYVRQNLGILYEKAGRMADARVQYDAAESLAPGRYAKDKARGNYNGELKAGDDDYKGGDWAGCVSHFTRALQLGRGLTHDDSLSIEGYIDDCSQRH